MTRRFSQKLAISALASIGTASLLGSCGGGKSSASPSPTPTSTAAATPTPTPAPTPTATPLAGTGFVDYIGDFAVLGYSATGTTGGSGGTGVTLAPGGIAFRRTSVSSGYELAVPNRDFGTLGSAVTYDHIFSLRSGSVASGPKPFIYQIASLIPGPSNSLLGLEHSGLVSWEAGVVLTGSGSSSTIDQNFGSFVYGKPTAASALPLTGSLTWTGKVFDPYNLPGPVTVTIDFATRVISGTLNANFGDGIGGIVSPGTFAISGSLPANADSFSYPFTLPGSGDSGTLTGRFAGPNGEELMLLWHARTTIASLSPDKADYFLPAVLRRS